MSLCGVLHLKETLAGMMRRSANLSMQLNGHVLRMQSGASAEAGSEADDCHQGGLVRGGRRPTHRQQM